MRTSSISLGQAATGAMIQAASDGGGPGQMTMSEDKATIERAAARENDWLCARHPEKGSSYKENNSGANKRPRSQGREILLGTVSASKRQTFSPAQRYVSSNFSFSVRRRRGVPV
jgi:hypothetical protein